MPNELPVPLYCCKLFDPSAGLPNGAEKTICEACGREVIFMPSNLEGVTKFEGRRPQIVCGECMDTIHEREGGFAFIRAAKDYATKGGKSDA